MINTYTSTDYQKCNVSLDAAKNELAKKALIDICRHFDYKLQLDHPIKEWEIRQRISIESAWNVTPHSQVWLIRFSFVAAWRNWNDASPGHWVKAHDAERPRDVYLIPEVEPVPMAVMDREPTMEELTARVRNTQFENVPIMFNGEKIKCYWKKVG